MSSGRTAQNDPILHNGADAGRVREELHLVRQVTSLVVVTITYRKSEFYAIEPINRYSAFREQP